MTRLERLLACGAVLCALPAFSWAQSLPESIRACAAQTNAGLRHACYDREVGRILQAEKKAAARREPATGCCTQPEQAAPRRAPEAPSAPQAAKAPAAPEAAAPHEPDRISARVASIDSSPDVLIVHLDNGETWQQTDTTAGALSLRPGDRITIEKHLGSYWLSARHISGMRVRRRSD